MQFALEADAEAVGGPERGLRFAQLGLLLGGGPGKTQILGEVARFGMNLLEHFVFREGAGTVRDTRAKSAQPVRGVGEGRDEIPAHENEGQRGDENGLDQRGKGGCAQRAHQASLYIAGIGDDHDDAEKFAILENGKRIDIQGGTINGYKIAGWRTNFCGAKGFGRRLIESHGESGGNGADGAGRIVDRDPAKAFAGHITIEKMA